MTPLLQDVYDAILYHVQNTPFLVLTGDILTHFKGLSQLIACPVDVWQYIYLADSTIPASLNQTTHGQGFIYCFFFSSPTRSITHFFADTQNTTKRIKEKNKRTKTDLGQFQVQEGGVLCDTFVQHFVHLRAIAGEYFARNFHKVTRNADSSLDCPASIFSLPLSTDCVLLWTAISSRLFSSALLCHLHSLSSLGPSSPPLLPVSREISPSGPLCGFRTKTDKKILSGTSSNGNKMLPIVSQIELSLVGMYFERNRNNLVRYVPKSI